MNEIDRKVTTFLKDELELSPATAAYNVLKKVIVAGIEDPESLTSITKITGKNRKNSYRNVRYAISKIYDSPGYIKVVGNSEIITPKDFIVKCYEFVTENYI